LNVWHKDIPEKLSVFAWRLLRNRLPTKDNLLRRRVLHHDDTMCVGGCGCPETTVHLFLICDIFGSTWSFLWCWLGIDFVPSGVLGEHFDQFARMAGMPRCTHSFFRVIWLACVWVIWKERNNCVFKNAMSDPCNLFDKVNLNSFMWLKSNKPSFSYYYHDWCRHPLLYMGVSM